MARQRDLARALDGGEPVDCGAFVRTTHRSAQRLEGRRELVLEGSARALLIHRNVRYLTTLLNVASENRTPAHSLGSAAAVFELKRFGWLTPDRLELSGTFGGLRDARLDASPALVIRAGDNVHRLAAVPDSLNGPPRDGRFWQAAFAGRDAPAGFDAAQLQLGAGLVIDLPAPGAKQKRSRARVLEVRTTHPDGTDPPGASSGIVRLPGTAADSTDRIPAAENPRRADAADASLGSQAELLAAQEEVRAVRIAMEQVAKELSRARDDLRSERERHGDDGERFRVGLAKLRESAEKALAVEQSAKRQMGSELREAHKALEEKDISSQALHSRLKEKDTASETLHSRLKAKDIALETLRSQLKEKDTASETLRSQLKEKDTASETLHSQLKEKDTASETLHSQLKEKDTASETLRTQLEAARTAIAQAKSTEERLRRQLARLESDGKETERLRAELVRNRATVDQAQHDVERLVDKLAAIRAR